VVRSNARRVAVGRWLVAILVATVAASGACGRETALQLGKAEKIADGVQLYRLNDPGLLDQSGAVAVQILRIDPAKADIRSVLAQDRPMQLETVPEMAARTKAVAAINAGFFVVKNGDPAGVLELEHELVSDTALTRGAVGIIRVPGKPARLLFDRVGAAVSLNYTLGTDHVTVEIDGVDTTRVRSKLMLYTPRFGPDSDTADTGVEWQLAGSPLRVTDRRPNAGKTVIPQGGAVLSFGGTVLPTGLESLERGQTVTLDVAFKTRFGTTSADWNRANDIVGGAGLLVRNGQLIREWADEQLRDGFSTERHPRTMIGSSKGGIIWLVTVDGRNPDVSIGMTFAELQRLALGLKLENALNLDGGGSTTMVVNGTVVNHPSDKTGPRKISDGIIVVAKK